MSPPTPQPAPDAIPPEAGMELAPGVRVPPGAVRFQFARSSGPGGQNVNKLNTKAELWVPLSALASSLTPAALDRLRGLAGRRVTQAGEIHLTAEAGRSQEGNREAALLRLRELIVAARVEPKRRKKTKPSRASQRRRVDAKRRRGEIKTMRRGGGD